MQEALADPLAIRPRGALCARVAPPGSRSITNRALAAAALASGVSRLTGVSESDDTCAMREGLRALGVAMELREGCWTLHGSGGRLRAPQRPIDVGASGTSARFLTALATLADGPVTVDGSARMRERPIADLVDALRALGAGAELLGRAGCPPVRLAGGGLAGGAASVDARRSSQYVSGILLAAPCASKDVTLSLAGGALVSRPFVELTLDVMRAFGAEPSWQEAGVLRVPARGYRACDYAVEPDAQAAVYAFAAAAIAGGRVRVEGIPAHSRQTDLRFLDALAAMGCRVTREANAVEVTGADTLRGIAIDMNEMPDAALALAVVALFAKGPTEIRNVANLRIKETDRLAALHSELARLGARVTGIDDGLRIEPAALRAAVVETYDDHRMAMSFALAGLRIPGLAIRNPACVAKTWPRFFESFATW